MLFFLNWPETLQTVTESSDITEIINSNLQINRIIAADVCQSTLVSLKKFQKTPIARQIIEIKKR